jgi:hypothetical protein
MNSDPRFALSQELEAKQTLLHQLRALAVEDPDFLTDLIEGETSLLELIAALDASILDDEFLVNGTKTALDKLQARKRSAENRIELKRRLLAHILQQIGLKTLRTSLSPPKTSRRAGGSHSRPNSIRTGSPRPSASREKALKEAEAIPDPEERGRALAAIETLHPMISGVTASNGGITLIWRV